MRACVFSLLSLIVILSQPHTAFAQMGPMAEMVTPQKYIIHYPTAKEFCTPTRTTFADAARSVLVNRGRRIRQHPNGGYAKAMFQAQGNNMFHTGADFGWFRVNEPVFAVANGVVRISHESMHSWLSKNGHKVPKGLAKAPWDWGNLVVIEHRLEDGSYVSTLYAHLANERLVQAGDIVSAGQQIGTIGSKSPKVNGGYEPHLHFGVINGRLAEPGNIMFLMPAGGQSVPVRVAEAGETQVTVELPPNAPMVRGVTLGKSYDMTHVEASKYTMEADWLWKALPMNMPLSGYQQNLGNWRDPLAFLREQIAKTTQAPLLYYTHDKKAEVTKHPVGQSAPSWEEISWLNRDETTKPILTASKGKLTCVYCFQSGCKLSRAAGWPTFNQLLTKFAGEDDVQFMAVQTAFGDTRRNTQASAKRLIDEHKLTIPVGHLSAEGERPAFLNNYGVRATPWVIVIDETGTVQVSTFMFNGTALAEEITRLKNAME